MLIQSVRLILMIIVVALLGEIEITSGKTVDNKNGTKNICSAAKKFLITYQETCVDSNKKPIGNTGNAQQPSADSTVVALCAAMLCPTGRNCPASTTPGKRFVNTDAIAESDQRMRIAMTRSSDRINPNDLCFSETANDHIQTVLTRLHLVLDYFNTLNKIKLNSVLLATRTIQAQIAIIFEKLQFGPDQSVLLKKFRFLQERSKNISMQLEETNGQNWNWVDRMTSTTFFWKMPNSRSSWKDWDILANKELYPVTEFKNLTEYHTNHEANNECYLQMITDCGLTQECADLLMDKSAILTTLGHNVRFFELAITMNCVNEVDFVNKFRVRGTDWQSALEAQCSIMWNEANIIANAGFPTGYKGLFLVHGTSCAFVGYPNFLNVDWMNHIMSWMDWTKNGCIAPDTKSGDGDASRQYDDIADNGEWCSHWETSMAVQILITHLRYLLQTCNQDISKN